jgi:GT2 family glycosyltransferase
MSSSTVRDVERIDFSNESRNGLVSIVIVCYHDLDLLGELIPSIGEQTYDDIETICVLNGDDEDTKDYLSDCEENIQIVEPDANLWYTGGNNVGVEAARGEYLFIINPDTVLNEGTVESLVDAADGNPDAGVLVPKLEFQYEEDTIDSIGMEFSVAGWPERIGTGDSVDSHDTSMEVPCFDGAGFLIRRSVIEDVGLFDRRFKYYQDTVDLSFRVFDAGWQVRTVPDTRMDHKRGGSIQDDRTSTVLFHSTRNDLLTLGKNYSYIYAVALLPIHLLWPLRRILKLIIKGETADAKHLSRGFISGLNHLPRELLSRDRLCFGAQRSFFFSLPKVASYDRQ